MIEKKTPGNIKGVYLFIVPDFYWDEPEAVKWLTKWQIWATMRGDHQHDNIFLVNYTKNNSTDEIILKTGNSKAQKWHASRSLFPT